MGEASSPRVPLGTGWGGGPCSREEPRLLLGDTAGDRADTIPGLVLGNPTLPSSQQLPLKSPGRPHHLVLASAASHSLLWVQSPSFLPEPCRIGPHPEQESQQLLAWGAAEWRSATPNTKGSGQGLRSRAQVRGSQALRLDTGLSWSLLPGPAPQPGQVSASRRHNLFWGTILRGGSDTTWGCPMGPER